jgi:hypothetical protein
MIPEGSWYVRCTDSSMHQMIQQAFWFLPINNNGENPALVISNSETDAQGLNWICSEPRETLLVRIDAALRAQMDESTIIEVQPGPIAR